MRAIAGIASAGCRDEVLKMLSRLSHRAKGSPVVTETEACTMGLLTATGGTGPNMGAERAGTCAYVSGGTLYLQRDPMGIVPLYYGRAADGRLCFASEVKALLDLTRVVYEMPPGSVYNGKRMETYYRLEMQAPSDEPPESLAAELRSRLNRAVERSVSGATMGAWLSGGLDSSSVVALARPHVKTLHTFAAGIGGAPDLDAARTVADFLETEHHEIVVSADDLLRLLPTVIYHLESFDALLVRSSLMNFLAGKAASEYASKVFSGEGGDELFAGYAYLKSLPATELAGELIDIANRLHNTALQRVDRCASAHGLTPCVSFLETPVVEFALRVPVEYKLRNGIEKWILRQALKDLLPQNIVDRPKAKFWEGAGVGDILAERAKRIPDSDFAAERKLPNGWILASKEELMYYRIFRDRFGELPDLEWMGRTKGATPAANKK